MVRLLFVGLCLMQHLELAHFDVLQLLHVAKSHLEAIICLSNSLLVLVFTRFNLELGDLLVLLNDVFFVFFDAPCVLFLLLNHFLLERILELGE